MRRLFYWLAIAFFALGPAGAVLLYAGDCTDPSDCEATSGYNAGVAIGGSIVAIGAGLISGGFAGSDPDAPAPSPDDGVLGPVAGGPPAPTTPRGGPPGALGDPDDLPPGGST